MERCSYARRVTAVAMVAFVSAAFAEILFGLLSAIRASRFSVRITEVEPQFFGVFRYVRNG
jgi:hypothetical protein